MKIYTSGKFAWGSAQVDYASEHPRNCEPHNDHRLYADGVEVSLLEKVDFVDLDAKRYRTIIGAANDRVRIMHGVNRLELHLADDVRAMTEDVGPVGPYHQAESEDAGPVGPPKVYILVEEPYHDNSNILGVFTTLEKAKAKLGADVWDESWERRDNVVACSQGVTARKIGQSLDDNAAMIYEVEVD